MIVIQSPDILVILIIKPKQKSDFIIRHIIAKKPVPADKGKAVSPFAFFQDNIPAGDPQDNLIVGKFLLGVLKKLVHIPLKVQKIHSVRSVSYPVKFHYPIIIFLPALGHGNIIFQQKTACLRRQLLYGDLGICFPGHLQIPPGNLLEATVNIYPAIGRIISLRIGLHILGELFRRFLIKSLPGKIRHIIQLVLYMEFLCAHYSGVISYLPCIFQLQNQNQHIFLIYVNQILQPKG